MSSSEAYVTDIKTMSDAVHTAATSRNYNREFADLQMDIEMHIWRTNEFTGRQANIAAEFAVREFKKQLGKFI